MDILIIKWFANCNRSQLPVRGNWHREVKDEDDLYVGREILLVRELLVTVNGYKKFICFLPVFAIYSLLNFPAPMHDYPGKTLNRTT